MGSTSGRSATRRAGDAQSPRDGRNSGPRNLDGTWVAGVARGPYRPVPFPVGSVFGELTIREWVNHKRGWHPRCSCSCGWEGVVDRDNLKRGRSSRCNACAKRKAGVTQKRYHGYADIVPDEFHRERLLNRISACIQRCENPSNSSWHHYGKRGIRVYPDWVADRRAFLAYVVSLEGWDVPHLELDRIDNSRGYEPGNLRFVSRGENMLNRRTVAALQERIRSLEAEVESLRHKLRGAE